MKIPHKTYLKALRDLEEIINSDIDPSLFPYKKGNSIRIGQFGIRENKAGFYKIFDCMSNKLVAETFCKSSAVAIARQRTKGNNNEKSIIELDRYIQKWYNDCVFYKHIMKVTTDKVKREITETRYEIAKHKTKDARNQLDKYIYA